MKVLGVIPARYRSSRFPGKPLALIHGLPMVVHVYRAATSCTAIDRVLVATDDKRIGTACDEHGIPWELTRDDHPTGTDRVAELAQRHRADIYVNIQGDEPMLHPSVIESAVRPLLADRERRWQVTNLCTEITDQAELIDTNVIKVALGPQGRAVYLSRQPIPFPKARAEVTFRKQVCVYAFRADALRRFAELPQGPLESAEGIELLRLLEHGIPVTFFDVDSRSVAVDTPEDLALVTALLEETRP